MDFTRLRGTQVPHDQNENIKHVEMVGNEINHVAYSANISAMKYKTMSSVLDKCNTVAMYFKPSPPLFFSYQSAFKKHPLWIWKNQHF